jgi:hypothetical protein
MVVILSPTHSRRTCVRLAVVLILAYLITAIFFVWRDLNERHLGRMKLYAMEYQRTGDWSQLLYSGIAWIFSAAFHAYFRGRLTDHETTPLMVFVVAAITFWDVSKWALPTI